jgi:hypothetical protein
MIFPATLPDLSVHALEPLAAAATRQIATPTTGPTSPALPKPSTQPVNPH